MPIIYVPIILAADFFRARLIGSAKATASLKLVAALTLAAVALILLTQVKFRRHPPSADFLLAATAAF